MKGDAYIYKLNGTIEHIKLDAAPTLELLNNAVGGHLEALYWPLYKGKQCVAYCNEEGIRLGLPMNRRATFEWYAAMLPLTTTDYLKGDIIILIGDKEFMDAQ